MPSRTCIWRCTIPADRRGLSYLATTRRGRRIYLNRTAVDADQLVLLTRRSYDCRMGYAGGEGALFPALSDEAARQEAARQALLRCPGRRTLAGPAGSDRSGLAAGGPVLRAGH